MSAEPQGIITGRQRVFSVAKPLREIFFQKYTPQPNLALIAQPNLLVFRGFAFASMLILTILWLLQTPTPLYLIIYLEDEGLMLALVYYTMSFLYSILMGFLGKHAVPQWEYWLEIFYQICLSIQFCVTIIHWTVVFKGLDNYSTLKIVSEVGARTVPILFLLIELLFCSARFKAVHLLIITAHGAGYSFTINLGYSISVRPIYSVLDWKGGMSWGFLFISYGIYAFGFAIGHAAYSCCKRQKLQNEANMRQLELIEQKKAEEERIQKERNEAEKFEQQQIAKRQQQARNGRNQTAIKHFTTQQQQLKKTLKKKKLQKQHAQRNGKSKEKQENIQASPQVESQRNLNKQKTEINKQKFQKLLAKRIQDGNKYKQKQAEMMQMMKMEKISQRQHQGESQTSLEVSNVSKEQGSIKKKKLEKLKSRLDKNYRQRSANLSNSKINTQQIHAKSQLGIQSRKVINNNFDEELPRDENKTVEQSCKELNGSDYIYNNRKSLSEEPQNSLGGFNEGYAGSSKWKIDEEEDQDSLK